MLPDFLLLVALAVQVVVVLFVIGLLVFISEDVHEGSWLLKDLNQDIVRSTCVWIGNHRPISGLLLEDGHELG